MCPHCQELGTTMVKGEMVCANCRSLVVPADWAKASEVYKNVRAARQVEAQPPPPVILPKLRITTAPASRKRK